MNMNTMNKILLTLAAAICFLLLSMMWNGVGLMLLLCLMWGIVGYKLAMRYRKPNPQTEPGRVMIETALIGLGCAVLPFLLIALTHGAGVFLALGLLCAVVAILL